LEANLLLDAAARLQAARDSWNDKSEILDSALQYNRKLWTILLTSVTSEENPMSSEIRQNVANLGLFVLKHTLTVIANPKPESLGSLININRELAAGLAARS
jgi:flagellar protein FlaF